MNVPQNLTSRLYDIFERANLPITVARAPGRIEVLGNHTDYNGGLVLATTINRFIWAAGLSSDEVNLHSLNLNESTAFDPKDPYPQVQSSWKNYARGVYWALRRRGHDVNGIKGAVYGDIPMESGLSSSAAFQVALVNLALTLSDKEVHPKAKAMIAFESERLFCGISCGIMDQFTSQLGQPASLLRIECRSLQTQNVPFDNKLRFVVVDSMIRRAASEALNERRMECLTALSQLQEAGWTIQSISEIREEDLPSLKDLLDDILVRRVSHIVNENKRVRKASETLELKELEEFGKLMVDSHNSSRDLYEVSHPMLDFLVETSLRYDGVFGARMTGAGLGGSIISLMKAEKVQDYSDMISQVYEKEIGETPEIIACEIPGGVITDTVIL